MTVGHLDGVEGLRKGADLIYLDQDRVGGTHLDAPLQELHIGDKQVVAHELTAFSDPFGQCHPVGPIVLIQAVLNGVDRIFIDERFEVGDLLGASQFLTVRILLLTVLQLSIIIEELTVFENGKLRCRTVHGDRHILARLIAGSLDGLHDGVEGIFDTIKVRCEASLITDGGGETAGLQQLGEVMKHLGTHADSLFQRLGPDGTDHELLEGDRRIGVGPAVHDVHHRHGECIGVRTTEVTVERHLQISGSSVGNRQRHTEDGIGTQVLLGRRTVERDHLRIDLPLFKGTHADDGRRNHLIDVIDRLLHTLAEITALVAIAKFQGLVLTSRGT